jgi:hypothetical protein
MSAPPGRPTDPRRGPFSQGDHDMPHHLLKSGALALVLGGLTAAGQAYAFTPLPIELASPLAIPVVDEQQQVDEHLNADQMPTNPPQLASPLAIPVVDEQQQVDEHLNADQMPTNPPPATVERKGEGQAGNGGGDVEIKELQNMFPSTPWPKEN